MNPTAHRKMNRSLEQANVNKGNKGKQLKKNIIIGCLNICGIKQKEEDLIDQMKKRNISILGLADTRTKGQGCKRLHQDYTYLYSGVNITEKAKHGVGFIIEKQTAKLILSTDYISERIMKTTIRENGENTTYIQIYSPCNAPNNDEECEEFYESINETINKIPKGENYFIMGDFNARTGYDRNGVEDYLGCFGDSESQRNENGCRLLELCNQHDLFITNTYFQHRKSHLYTWYKWNDVECKSQIDYILAKRIKKRTVTDARAIPNLSTDTDHKAVIVKIRTNRTNQRKYQRVEKETIKINQLNDSKTQEIYQIKIEENYNKLPQEIQSVEEEWTTFKNTILDTARETCGTTKSGGTRPKITPWWNT